MWHTQGFSKTCPADLVFFLYNTNFQTHPINHQSKSFDQISRVLNRNLCPLQHTQMFSKILPGDLVSDPR